MDCPFCQLEKHKEELIEQITKQAGKIIQLQAELAELADEKEENKQLKEIMDRAILDYGYSNGWGGKIPVLIKRCAEQKHKTQEQSLRMFTRVIWCDVCRYKYKVDSSWNLLLGE